MFRLFPLLLILYINYAPCESAIFQEFAMLPSEVSGQAVTVVHHTKDRNLLLKSHIRMTEPAFGSQSYWAWYKYFEESSTFKKFRASMIASVQMHIEFLLFMEKFCDAGDSVSTALAPTVIAQWLQNFERAVYERFSREVYAFIPSRTTLDYIRRFFSVQTTSRADFDQLKKLLIDDLSLLLTYTYKHFLSFSDLVETFRLPGGSDDEFMDALDNLDTMDKKIDSCTHNPKWTTAFTNEMYSFSINTFKSQLESASTLYDEFVTDMPDRDPMAVADAKGLDAEIDTAAKDDGGAGIDSKTGLPVKARAGVAVGSATEKELEYLHAAVMSGRKAIFEDRIEKAVKRVDGLRSWARISRSGEQSEGTVDIEIRVDTKSKHVTIKSVASLDPSMEKVLNRSSEAIVKWAEVQSQVWTALSTYHVREAFASPGGVAMTLEFFRDLLCYASSPNDSVVAVNLWGRAQDKDMNIVHTSEESQSPYREGWTFVKQTYLGNSAEPNSALAVELYSTALKWNMKKRWGVCEIGSLQSGKEWKENAGSGFIFPSTMDATSDLHLIYPVCLQLYPRGTKVVVKTTVPDGYVDAISKKKKKRLVDIRPSGTMQEVYLKSQCAAAPGELVPFGSKKKGAPMYRLSDSNEFAEARGKVDMRASTDGMF